MSQCLQTCYIKRTSTPPLNLAPLPSSKILSSRPAGAPATASADYACGRKRSALHRQINKRTELRCD